MLEEDPLELLTPERLAELLSVKKEWLYEQARTGDLPTVRLGRQLRFRRSDVMDWLDAQKAIR